MQSSNVETSWESYEFHYSILEKLQSKNDEVIVKYNNFIDKNLEPRQKEVLKIKKEMNESYNSLVVAYEKCISSIDELISAYKSSSDIPDGMEISQDCLKEYKSITMSQYELAKMEQKEINDVLG